MQQYSDVTTVKSEFSMSLSEAEEYEKSVSQTPEKLKQANAKML